MISFKISREKHRKFSAASKKFFTVAFFGMLIFLGYMIVSEYRSASAILADATITDAAIELVDVTEVRRRRGRTSEMYHFAYNFEVDGKQFRGSFEASESNADKYLNAETVRIAYANADPDRSDRLEHLESQGSIGSWLKRIAIIVPVMVLLAGLFHLLLTQRLIVPREPEADPQAA